MLGKLFAKLFGKKQDKDWEELAPLIELINEKEKEFSDFTDEQFPEKTKEFRQRYDNGETLDDMMVEAFALVKAACRKLCGRSWEVCGNQQPWEMVPFDVQLAGGIALHQGKITEMATGEGKTLVSTMPLYLNGLTGKGAHLVTVNDYLARRDCEWMGGLYNFLGLSVGCIQMGMPPVLRRQQYAANITYGTNSEFGFDYLRDNMAHTKEELCQPFHHYCIIDEVDSVLIDEARTPLIISGPIENSTNRYNELRPAVLNLFHLQDKLMQQLMDESEKLIQEDDENQKKLLGCNLLKIKRGSPKMKTFLETMTDAKLKRLVEDTELDFLREKNMRELDEEMYFAIDEKSQVIDLTDMGRNALSNGKPEDFVLPDMIEEIQKIDEDEALDPKAKIAAKDVLYRENEQKSEAIHNINQLVRAYSLFEKDVDYVVMEGKVMIVDEFTGRLMPGRRFSDGLHQALEAKESVKVEAENQTLATITIQNYFRMYDKLAGMTGTAETEAAEFKEIYDLDVVVIPTNKPIERKDLEDSIYMTQKGKYKAIIEEIERVHSKKMPILVGTVSVEVSELISRMLKQKRITHHVLNAKNHQHEAEIVKNAGKAGSVTIATNMAGRGTDIKLAPEVFELSKKYAEENPDEYLGGLHVIGTARHESRRIDRQLRGRSGRQGDPGVSRFFLSLEDDLMRLFGSDRITGILSRMGLKEEEEIQHAMISRTIEKAQAKVEGIHFESRKYTLKFDDVINKHREVIYGYRKKALQLPRLKEVILEMVDDLIFNEVDDNFSVKRKKKTEFDIPAMTHWLQNMVFMIDLTDIEKHQNTTVDEMVDYIMGQINELYSVREEILGEFIEPVERVVVLSNIDKNWQEHLRAIDDIRDGVSLRAYGQKDPLNEFKMEAYKTFYELMNTIRKGVFEQFFRLQVVQREEEPVEEQELHYGAPENKGAGQTTAKKNGQPGRNDPCPCGSGKKYKKCCGAND